MTLIHLALVVEAPQVSRRAVSEIAAALQRQLTRDVAPIWEVHATIDAFASLEHVPPGYWPILVGDHFPGVESVGIHLDRNGQPFALVEASPSWSLTASHEAIEMVTDPWGNRTVPGGSPMAGQGLVEILVEVCDPPGGAQWAYTVNGYLVSDFCTPNYFDPVGAPGVRYSFTGALTGPRQILEGGYLSWRDPATGDWWQGDRIEQSELAFRRLGRLDEDGRPIRERVDDHTPMVQLYTGTSRADPALRNAYERRASTRMAARARAAAVRGRMRDLGLD
ncbi:MAG: hypothetical protein JHC74_11910 [Thermoleophilia bacterium]|nr:hypothetical protein [Thermoleophilia bacterium]